MKFQRVAYRSLQEATNGGEVEVCISKMACKVTGTADVQESGFQNVDAELRAGCTVGNVNR